MAWYTKPTLAPRIIGSSGGVTFQKTAAKFIIRRRAVPVDKNTELQRIRRNQFENVQGSWRNLSPAQQLTWLTEKPNYLRVNSIGDSYEISDINLFCSSNRNKQGANQSQLLSIPSSTAAAVPVLGSFVFDPVGLIFTVNLSPGIIPANRTLFYYITDFSLTERPFNFNNIFQLFATNTAGFNTTTNIWSQFVARIQMEPASGITHYRNFAAVFMDDLTGQVSPTLNFVINYTF